MLPLLSYMSLLKRYITIQESRIPVSISLVWPVCRSICLILLIIYVRLHHYIGNVVIANTKFEWWDCQTHQLLYTYIWAWLVVCVWQFSNIAHCEKWTKVYSEENYFLAKLILININKWTAGINAIVSNSMEVICI